MNIPKADTHFNFWQYERKYLYISTTDKASYLNDHLFKKFLSDEVDVISKNYFPM